MPLRSPAPYLGGYAAGSGTLVVIDKEAGKTFASAETSSLAQESAAQSAQLVEISVRDTMGCAGGCHRKPYPSRNQLHTVLMASLSALIGALPKRKISIALGRPVALVGHASCAVHRRRAPPSHC